MQSDRVATHILWRSTSLRVEQLRSAVREGVAVQEASAFGRWLLNSGVLGFLSEQDFQVKRTELEQINSQLAHLTAELAKLAQQNSATESGNALRLFQAG